ncbi:MAG: T9SS type A sorting domain-containing protein [Bacteroidota bacterium]
MRTPERFLTLALVVCLTMLFAGSASAQIQSAATGGWSKPATWVGGVVPTATDNVEIVAGHTVTIDTVTAECKDLTANGYLFFDILSSGYKLTVHGNATVGATGRLRGASGTPVAPRSHDVVFEKNLTVLTGGSFDMRVGSGANVSVGRVTFSGSTNDTIRLSLTTYGSSVEEFNSIIINKSGSGRVILASGNLYQNNNTSNSPDTLVLISGIVETGSNYWAILRTSSAAVLGGSASSYFIGYLGRGVTNGGGTTALDFPMGDGVNYRPINVRCFGPANATGHFVWAKYMSGNANTGSSTLGSGIDKVSAVRYYAVGYLQNAGSSATMGFDRFSVSYGSDDGVSSGNTDLRVAYSTDSLASWTAMPQTINDTTYIPDTQIQSDTLSTAITINTGAKVYLALARKTGTTTNTLGSGGTSVGDGTELAPGEYRLGQNYPNPFNPSTAISYQLSAVSDVSLKVFDVLGREVETLVSGVMPAGTYKATWNAGSSPSGIYFCKFQAGERMEVRKMVLMK